MVAPQQRGRSGSLFGWRLTSRARLLGCRRLVPDPMPPVPLTASELTSLVKLPPVPLISKELRLALLFSAKSGCTFAVKWFFEQMGLLTAAQHYDPWIHRYREKVFNESTTYRLEFMHLLDETTRVLRVVREPYSRCVSSFLHAVRYGYEDDDLGRFLGRRIDRKNGFSFREWIDYLESIDLRRCDVHHRLQAHELELLGVVIPDRIVRLEDGRDEFRRVEEEWGLRSVDLDKFRSSIHHTERASQAEFSGDQRFAMTPQDKGGIPPTAAFYDDELRTRVAALYAEDFRRYGYDEGADL